MARQLTKRSFACAEHTLYGYSKWSRRRPPVDRMAATTTALHAPPEIAEDNGAGMRSEPVRGGDSREQPRLNGSHHGARST
jgi:hypothetical protein